MDDMDHNAGRPLTAGKLVELRRTFEGAGPTVSFEAPARQERRIDDRADKGTQWTEVNS